MKNEPSIPPLPSLIFDWKKLVAEKVPGGERRPMFDGATSTVDRLAVHATTLRPGERAHEPHRHPEEEMIIVKEGTLEATLNESTTRIEPGSVFFVAPQDLHGVKNVGKGMATYYVLRWWTPATG